MVNVAEEVEVGFPGFPGPASSTVTRNQTLPLLRIFGLDLRSGFLKPGTLTLVLSRYRHLRAAGCHHPMHFLQQVPGVITLQLHSAGSGPCVRCPVVIY